MLIQQIMPMFYFFVSLTLLFVLLPSLFIRKSFQDGLEQFASNVLKITSVLIVLGYALVMLRLFEMLSVVFLLTFIIKRIYQARRKQSGLHETASKFETMIYEYFDGKFKIRSVLRSYFHQRMLGIKHLLGQRFATPLRSAGTLAVLIVLGTAAYMRVYDVLTEVAPSYGHRYTALKWIKDIRENILFADGVVPLGFHVFWATVQEFARIDTLFIVNYAGPFVSMALLAGIYFFLSRLTGSKLAGIVGLIVSALLGEFIDPLYWQWQTEADPRTFAFAFYLPTLYFMILYLRGMNREALLTMCSGMLIMALTDLMAYLLLLVGALLVIVILLLGRRLKESPTIARTMLAWTAAGVLSLLPLGVGLSLGGRLHEIWIQSFESKPKAPFLLTAGPSISVLVVSAAAGLAWYSMFRFHTRSAKSKLVEACVLALALVLCLRMSSIQPVHPPKVEWGAAVAQYVKITQQYAPLNWMIVGKDSWTAIARGGGYHMSVDELVANYDPTREYLTRMGSRQPDPNIPSHVFMFYEKQLRQASIDAEAAGLAGSYAKWSKDMDKLRKWLNSNSQLHGKAKLYYEDDQLMIYHFEYDRDSNETIRQSGKEAE